MKLDQTRFAQNNLGSIEDADFQVAVNGKTFKILLDDIYTNKIRALIRELAANAVDAHRDAGTSDTPFDIHMPNSLYPMFRIRDYGTGLSHQQIMTLYVTLFESTKDQSNDDTGMFGLGSKVPFAYTDGFVVTSYQNGEKRVYSCNIGTTGAPGISYMGAEETDEPNGLEVEVAVKSHDFDRFADEMEHLALGFPVRPNIIGMDRSVVEPSFVSPDGSVMVIPRRYYESMWAIRQGCAIYPVPSNVASAHPAINRTAYGLTIVVDVPIGTVSVAPNRESLSLNDETREALQAVIYGASAKLVADAQAVIDSAPNRLTVLNSLADIDSTRLIRATALDYSKHETPKAPDAGRWYLNRYVPLHGGSKWEPPLVRLGGSRKPERLYHIDLNAVDRYRFILRDTQNPVKRETLRYRAFVKANGHNLEIALCDDLDPKVIERIMTLAGVKREQFIPISQLEDPGPPARNSNPDRVLAGVNYHSTGYTARPVKELPSDYLYYELTTYNARDDRVIMDRKISYAKKAGLLKDDKNILTMTPKAVLRYKVDSKRQLTTYIADAAQRKLLKLRKTLLNEQIRELIGDPVVSKALGYVHIPCPEMDELLHLSDGSLYNEVREEARGIVGELKEKYPLLFTRSEDVVQSYIALRDDELKAKESN